MRARATAKCGWLLAGCYVVIAGLLFYRASSCSGWVCDLVALPAAFPFGFPIAWLIDAMDSWLLIPGHTPTFHFRSLYFIVPTMIANALLYFWIGKALGMLTHGLFSKTRTTR